MDGVRSESNGSLSEYRAMWHASLKPLTW